MKLYLLEETRFLDELKSSELNEEQFRLILFYYCKEYQEIFYHDWLEDAIEVLEERIIGKTDELEELLEDAKDEVYPYMFETFSFSKVSEVVMYLLENKSLSKEILIEKIEDVLYPIEMNSEAGFMEDEDKKLCKILSMVKANKKVN